jgi:hypothetical protein
MVGRYLSLSLFPVAPNLEQRASVKRFVSLQFLNPKTVGRTPWIGDQPVARPLHIQAENKHKQTSMSWVGFEPTIPAFERAKTVHPLDLAAAVISWNWRIVVRFSELAWHIQTVLKISHIGRTDVTVLVLWQFFIDSYSIRYYSLVVNSVNPLHTQPTPLRWECTCLLHADSSIRAWCLKHCCVMVRGNIASSLVYVYWRVKDTNFLKKALLLQYLINCFILFAFR